MSTPNWQHNSGKRKRTKGRSKALIRAKRQAKEALKARLFYARMSK